MKDTNSNNSYVELQIRICNLYLENKEVTAELGANGRIVKENNYVTYK